MQHCCITSLCILHSYRSKKFQCFRQPAVRPDRCVDNMKNPRDAQRVLPQQQSSLRAVFIAFLFRDGREMVDPLPGKSASIERACQSASVERASRCASRGTFQQFQHERSNVLIIIDNENARSHGISSHSFSNVTRTSALR
jgi:hypothetical protein